MSTFTGPAEHAANPPETWRPVKVAERCWHLLTANGDCLDTFTTCRAATEAIKHGVARRLYDDEARWYAGEQVAGWRPWAEVLAERERRAR